MDDTEHIQDFQDNTQLEIHDQKERFLDDLVGMSSPPVHSERFIDGLIGTSSAPVRSPPASSANSRKRAHDVNANKNNVVDGSPKRQRVISKIKDELAQEVLASVSEDLQKLKPLLERFHLDNLRNDLRIILDGDETAGNRAEEERVAAIEELLNEIRVILSGVE